MFQCIATDTIHQAVSADASSRHLSLVSCIASWTTVTLCLLVIQSMIFNVCIQCSMLLCNSFKFIQSLSCHAVAKGSSLAAYQTACAVQAVHASPLLFVRRGTILSCRVHCPEHHCKQQTWSEVCTVAVPRCATYSLDTLRPHVLHRCTLSFEQPSTAGPKNPFLCPDRRRRTCSVREDKV